MGVMVRHSRGEYAVEFADWGRVAEAMPDDAFVVTDRTVAALMPEGLAEEGRIFALEPGEQEKTFANVGRVCEWLSRAGASRRSVVVAIGGGVTGDLAGFAAAIYQRGVGFWQVPTTLLAMVDSSVGGKTGVDLESGKNLVGAFWAPEHVIVPMDALRTLPEREVRAGAAEMWKMGAIRDAGLWAELERESVSAARPGLAGLVEACVAHKAEVVEADEFETTGLRATLNFGHTVGHALEALTRYAAFLHGEAVAIGMVAEAEIGERLGVTAGGTAARLRAGLAEQGLPTALPEGLDVGRMLDFMRRDKKSAGGKISISLLTELGACKLVRDVPDDVIAAALGTG